MLLVLALCASYLTLFSGADSSLTAESSVISSELQAVMAATSATEKIPVSIWTNEIDSEAVEAFALDKTGLNRDKIREMVSDGKEASLTSEAIDEYIAAEREIYKRLQTSAHQAFAKEYAFLQTAIGQKGAYVCSYAPMMIVEVTAEQVEVLAANSSVVSLEYAEETEMVSELDIATNVTKAAYTRDTSGYELTGKGVKIGMIESGLPDIENFSCFDDGDAETNHVTLITNGSTSTTEHATAVASIIISQENSAFRGLAPDAELYCVGLSGGISFYSGVEQLLDVGVNVINMSAGGATSPGTEDRWVDHLAINHSVHFVKSAGNTGNAVTSPGYAYNIFTVGNLDDRNTAELSDDILSIYTAYNEPVLEDYIPTNKPELVAPGTKITVAPYPTEEKTGTSFAAPHVTGIIAQLLEDRPSLKVLQDTMKAILTAAVSHPVHRYDMSDANYERYGAGVVNAKEAEYVIRYARYRNSYFSASTDTPAPKTYTFTVSDSDEIIRVSLAWLKYNKLSMEAHTGTPDVIEPLTNLNLTVITPNNTRITVPTGESVNNNLEIIELDPDVYGTGTYTIEVSVVGSVTRKTYFSVAWW